MMRMPFNLMTKQEEMSRGCNNNQQEIVQPNKKRCVGRGCNNNKQDNIPPKDMRKIVQPKKKRCVGGWNNSRLSLLATSKMN